MFFNHPEKKLRIAEIKIIDATLREALPMNIMIENIRRATMASTKSAAKSFWENGPKGKQLAHGCVLESMRNYCFNELIMGHNHIYRGTLSLKGGDLKSVYYALKDMYLDWVELISPQELLDVQADLDVESSQLESEIRAVG